MHTMTFPMGRHADPRVHGAMADEAPPTVASFGRYEVLMPLGEGGDARVYMGQTRGPAEARRLVAIKHINSDRSHQELWKAAAQEARVGARIRHANVVGVLEVDDGGIGPYIVMDYVEGGTLVDLLSRCFERTGGREGLPLEVALRVILDGLFGLHAAHELRDEQGRSLALVHRDVSPQNILVGVDGASRITDFGIARLRYAVRTAPGLVRGKAGYLAPEQILGRPLDSRTDVFAMGIVLWESLTGNRLFRGKTMDEVLSAVLEQPVASPSSFPARVPEAVAKVCLRALEREPARRWQTARAFADALAGAARDDRGVDIATQGEVADYVERVLEEVLQRRRSVIRAAECGDAHEEDDVDALTIPARRLPVLPDAVTSERHLPSCIVQPEAPLVPRPAPTTVSSKREGRTLTVMAGVAALFAVISAIAIALVLLRTSPGLR